MGCVAHACSSRKLREAEDHKLESYLGNVETLQLKKAII